MGNEWSVVPLSTFAKVLSGFAFKGADMGESGCPIIKIKNINPPNVDVADVRRVSLSIIEGNKRIEKFRLTKGDVLIAMTGATVGKVGRMPQSSETHYLNQRVGKVFLTDNNAADYDYVYYVLSQCGHVDQMLGLADGSAQPNISGAQIESLEIPLPSLPEQKAIAHILGSLDDKIELNRRMNETLEGMAQALFKSWFVDFDPVLDNAILAGNSIPDEFAQRAEVRRKVLAQNQPSPNISLGERDFPDLGKTAAEFPSIGNKSSNVRKNFPDSFQTSELGPIPTGWAEKPLDKIADYKNGLALQKFRPKEGEDPLPIVKIAQLKTGEATWDEVASPQISPECIIDDGDVVFSWSGSLMIDIWCGGKAALNQHLFKVTSVNFPKWFYLGWSNEHLRNFQHIAEAKAVTMGHIKRSHLSEALCAVPDERLLGEGSKIINPYIEKIIGNRLQNKALAKLRDTLLPKLISGEVRTVKGEG